MSRPTQPLGTIGDATATQSVKTKPFIYPVAVVEAAARSLTALSVARLSFAMASAVPADFPEAVSACLRVIRAGLEGHERELRRLNGEVE